MECFFNDCTNEVVNGSWKCVFHRHRARCLVSDCQNQVYARNLCVRHGGKKLCEVDGCGLKARLDNVCSKHGAGNVKKRCTHEGCTKQAHARQKCVRHGGGRKCKIQDCMSHARNSGYCSRHSRLLVSEPTSKLSISGLDVIQIESDRRMTVPQDKSAPTIQLQLVDLDDDVNPSGVYFDVGNRWDDESLVRQIDAINLSSQYPTSGKPVDLSLSPSMLTMLEGL